jgi:hypothetical protein
LPLRWHDDRRWSELAAYLRWLSKRVREVIVVDGSPHALYERHAADAAGHWRQLRPDPGLDFAMGKVNGVTTGVRAASHELVVIADDDVRYDETSLRRVTSLLARAALVRPQNYFEPLPWHARLDTARTLLNRVFTGDRQFPVGDFPGTLAIRRSAFEATDGYDGDVIFENLELMRTVHASGGEILTPLDLFVRRLPPTTSHFLSQRVRQAYDDFAIPPRLLVCLAAVPVTVLALATGHRAKLAAGTLGVIAVAELGRRRGGGRRHFPASSAFLAPIWLIERSISGWVALYRRFTLGGVAYAGRIVSRAANPTGSLRRRCSVDLLPTGASGAESDQLMRTVAEREVSRSPAAADRDHPALKRNLGSTRVD